MTELNGFEREPIYSMPFEQIVNGRQEKVINRSVVRNVFLRDHIRPHPKDDLHHSRLRLVDVQRD
ncbi:MAG: hypothetical protein IT405_03570 [Candidatus Yanofskybacteria bacterium]|nr:hypothetical protein [Candidatus Yanofskybacteria bacterium]